MRLLERNSNGEFSLTKDLVNNLPAYAILSHTWGEDDQEVTFQDLMERSGKSKAGYQKIRFCGEQAARDGLRYFWVDTCCINKSDAAELQKSINSMFRWYKNAVKCYVYLSDVSIPDNKVKSQSKIDFESAFQTAKWFTRGWTLQELLAPSSVEFFSADRKRLGDKLSLEHLIHERTGIPVEALYRYDPTTFSVDERISWAAKRETKHEEDMAYSLLGIFSIFLPLIYGEGRDHAFRRLREEVERTSKGRNFNDFSIVFSLSGVSEAEHFVAREAELAEIHKTLSSNGGRRIGVLHGLGGIGKTQLAVAYAKRYRDSYSAIFWFNIRDEDSLKQSFAKNAKRILREHPSAGRLSSINMNENLDEVIDAVKEWLSLPKNTRWLAIYDNYDTPKLPGKTDPIALDIQQFLPESYHGSIIITTRSSQVTIGYQMQVRKLENEKDSLKILLNTSRREGLINDPDVIKLAKKLDGFPLALATAGAYLKQVTMSFSDYLRLYEASWKKLQETSPQLTSYEDGTLYSTWQLSFDRVEQQNGLSAKLLRLWAYFDNQDLWFELLRHGDSEDPEWIRELTKDDLSFHDAVRVLSDHGLVEVDISSLELTESRGYSIHGCVHSWTIHALNQKWDYDLARVAVKSVGSHVPGNGAIQPWLTQRRLLQHAARCSYIVLNNLVRDNRMEWIYNNLGELYHNQDRLAEAEQMCQRALQVTEKSVGIEPTTILIIVNNLGALCWKQGKLAEAEQMYYRALQGKEKALGIEHTSTLDTVNNLGLLYQDQGKLAEAQQMYHRALQGREKALGAEHTSTLDTVNNLGVLCWKQGKLAEAEQLYQRALQGYEKALGVEHTSTLDTVNNLGPLYQEQGKLVEAEQMYHRALRGKEKALGVEHTSTLDTVNNLGILCWMQGKPTEAEQMYQRALQGKEKALGVEHMSTLQTVSNLGAFYYQQGKLAEAEQMYQRALQGTKKTLGVEHTTTLSILNNLGLLYNSQGKLAEAEQMYQRALQGFEKALDSKNATNYIPALRTISNLGSLFRRQSDLVNARIMYSRALVGYEKVFGPDHPESQSVRDILQILDTVTEDEARRDEDEPVDNSQGETSRVGAERASKISKRHKLLEKLGFR